MKNLVKVIFSSIILLVILTNMTLVANAAEQLGTINFKAINNSNSSNISGLKVNVYQIGKTTNNSFEYTDSFKDKEINLENMTEENIAKIEQIATQNATPIFEKTTDSKGEFTLSNIDLGVYLFVQANGKDNVTMQTMLVTIPETIDNKPFNYNLTIKPKIVSIEKKEENKNNQSTPAQSPASPTGSSTGSSMSSNKELPYTGVLNWPVPVLVVLAIILFSIGWLKTFTDSKKKIK